MDSSGLSFWLMRLPCSAGAGSVGDGRIVQESCLDFLPFLASGA